MCEIARGCIFSSTFWDCIPRIVSNFCLSVGHAAAILQGVARGCCAPHASPVNFAKQRGRKRALSGEWTRTRKKGGRKKFRFLPGVIFKTPGMPKGILCAELKEKQSVVAGKWDSYTSCKLFDAFKLSSAHNLNVLNLNVTFPSSSDMQIRWKQPGSIATLSLIISHWINSVSRAHVELNFTRARYTFR